MSQNGITERELSDSLATKIKKFLAHILDLSSHITDDERKTFNDKVGFDDTAVVSDSRVGLMSPTMKKKIDNVEENANNYQHPIQLNLTPGTYSLITVDKYGHIVLAENGKYIDAIAKDSELLDGFSSDDFVKSRDGVLLGKPQAPTPEITDSSNAIATTKFIKRLIGADGEDSGDGDEVGLPGTIVEAETPPSNKKQLWVNSTNGVLHYYSTLRNGWTPVVGVFDTVE